MIHGENTVHAYIAAMYHDRFKEYTLEQLNEFVVKYSIEQKYLGNKNLSHSKVAAAWLRENWKDELPEIEYAEDVIRAISYHTTGRANMSTLEKIVYLADGIEPLRDYLGVEELRKVAKLDLDKACLLYGKRTVEFLISKGIKSADDDTLLMIESLS